MDTPEQIAYSESVRAIDAQARMLDEVRSRTGIVLAGASIAGSFLGAQALRGSDFDGPAKFAVLALLAVMVFGFVILWPRRNWQFAVGARSLLEAWTGENSHGDVTAMRRHLAEELEDAWESNDGKLKRLYVLFECMIVALGCEVVLWTVKIASES